MMISRLVLALVGAAGLAAAQNVISIPVPLGRFEVSPAHSGSSEFGKRLKGNLDNVGSTREFVSVADVGAANKAMPGAQSSPNRFRPSREARTNRVWPEPATPACLPFTTKRNGAANSV